MTDPEITGLYAALDNMRAQRDEAVELIANLEGRRTNLLLEDEKARANALHEQVEDLCEQLAKMPHTPDGTLVVLGKTRLWQKSQWDGILHGIVTMTINRGTGILCAAEWLDRDNDLQANNAVLLTKCYGSEAELLKGETNA